MNQKYLRTIRATLGVLVLVLFTACFLMRDQNHPVFQTLAHLQAIPALMMMGASLLPIVVLLALTLLLGRIYCSVLCPLGLLQDVFNRLAKMVRKKKKKFIYVKPNTITRYSILVTTVFAWIVGFNAAVSLLDPYGAFGRIASNIMRPLYYGINNMLAWVLNSFDIYSVYKISVKTVSVSAAMVASVTLLVVSVMLLLRGRLYCNSICPVGTGLGLLSKLSLFRVKIGDGGCNSCGLCAMNCKSSCIDSKAKEIDQTRCVSCYSCLSVCNRNAVKLQWSYRKKSAAPVDEDKRNAMVAGVVALAALPASAMAQVVAKPLYFSGDDPIMPPGARSIKNFRNKCTACHLCVSKCPSQVIKPSFLEYGLAGMLQPRMDYKISFCTYDCTVCSTVCPNGALGELTKEDKHDLQIGKAHFDREICVVYTDETDCGACSEHCPTQAVHMVPYKNGLRIPEVNVNICVGCGGCQYICPVRPHTAIHVSGSSEQIALHIQKDKPQEEVAVDDFGF
ncbi:MAG: 4Fe-4S binding protein [Prevotellaceae bacterium]|nr:4Fe-4S binding protein [Prevotellaceae bacterium]